MKLIPSLCVAMSLLFASHTTFAGDRFSKEVARATGDLNKDGRPDLVIVTQDTIAADKPYRLQIFFLRPDGKYTLEISSEKAIEPQLPGGSDYGAEFDTATIDGGVLIFGRQLLRGHYEHKFRYQNGNFELIGFRDDESDGQGTCSTIDFNLSTGVRIEKDEDCGDDKVIRNVKKKIMIRPLPKLQDFEPMQNENY